MKILTPDGSTEEVPLFEELEAKTEYINYCFKVEQPAFLINKVRGRTWCFVECDGLPIEGLDTTNLVYDNRNMGLTQDAAEEVNEVCEEFDDEELRYSLSAGALSTRPGATFISFPDMQVDVARRFAERLKPIFMDPGNWESTLD